MLEKCHVLGGLESERAELGSKRSTAHFLRLQVALANNPLLLLAPWQRT